MDQRQQRSEVSSVPTNGPVAVRPAGVPAVIANSQALTRPARAMLRASAGALDDAKTEAIVAALANFNLRREYILRSLENDCLASSLVHHLRQETERAFLRILKG